MSFKITVFCSVNSNKENHSIRNTLMMFMRLIRKNNKDIFLYDKQFVVVEIDIAH